MRCCALYYESFDISITRRHANGYELHGTSNKKFFKTSLILQTVSCVVCFIIFSCAVAAIVADDAYNEEVIDLAIEVLAENSDGLEKAFGGVEKYREEMWRSSILYSIFVATAGLWCFASIAQVFCFGFYNNYLLRILWTAWFQICGFISCIVWIVLIKFQRDEALKHTTDISNRIDKAHQSGTEFTENFFDKGHSLFYYCEISRLPSEKIHMLLDQYKLCPSNGLRVSAMVFVFLEMLSSIIILIVTWYWRRTAKRIFDIHEDSENSSISSYSGTEGSLSSMSSASGSEADNVNYELSIASDTSIKPTNYGKLNERR